MIVKTQSKGREFTGVDVGANNVRRYFPREMDVIDIEIDHLQIQCRLSPGFWEGLPEIRDRRLSAWLKSKNFHGKPGAKAIPLALIPSGRNCFRLRPIQTGRQ
jgi:hypothetical protein